MCSIQHVPFSVNSVTCWLLRVSHHATDKEDKRKNPEDRGNAPVGLKSIGGRLLFGATARLREGGYTVDKHLLLAQQRNQQTGDGGWRLDNPWTVGATLNVTEESHHCGACAAASMYLAMIDHIIHR